MSAFNDGVNWIVKDGHAIADKAGISTKQSFGDCQLHLEFMSPPEDKGQGQGRGNSGIFLMGKYEVQILDSYNNDTYYDGQAAAIYKQSPPLVNASRPPGQWQTYDILFRAPKFDQNGTLEMPAALTVLHNGLVVQNHFDLKGDTPWSRPPAYEPHEDKLPLQIQFHGDPVRFRNIWIRELGQRPRHQGGAPGVEPESKNSAVVKPDSELLWAKGAPGAKGEQEADKPTLDVYLPEKTDSKKTAVIVFPGGSYQMLAKGHEGREIAEWLNSLGIAAFVCDYRHQGKGYGHPAPLQDAQRAVRLVRANAERFQIDPDRVGVLGFSAGGHLASSAATQFNSGDSTATDPIEQVSCRPDFAILGYPVIA
ncbi:MAG: DUF1080 domain-containing protein, partial [Planctomycetales bacterium]